MSVRKWTQRHWESDVITDIRAYGTDKNVRLNDLCWNIDDKTMYYCATVTATTSTWTATSGGSGGITEVTSTGSTVTVTNGTGPTVNLEVPAAGPTTIEAIDISGLSGVQGAWDMEGDVLDRSGNGIDLDTAPSASNYLTYQGKMCASRFGTDTWGRTGNDSELTILGDFTGHQLVVPLQQTGTFFAFWLSGGTSASNQLYCLEATTNGSVRYIAQSGAGTYQTSTFGLSAPLGAWALMSVTRNGTSGDVKLYINGMPAGIEMANTPPTDGSTSRFRLYGKTNAGMVSHVGDTVIQDVEMSAADILSIAQQVGVTA